MTLPVRVTDRAEHDADSIFAWLAERSTGGALRWYEAFLDTLRALPAKATACGLAPESEWCKMDVRQAIFKTRQGRAYRALFVIEGKIIHVVGVRGAGQDWATTEDLDLPQ